MKIIFLFILSFIQAYTSSSELDELLLRFHRPFTMMAIGGDPQVTLKAAKLYPKSVFIIANSEITTSLPNVIILSKRLNSDDLKVLGECENLDIVYIPDIKQIAAKNYYERIKVIEKLAHYALIGSPNSNLLSLLHSENNYILRKSWERGLHSEASHKVYSDFKEKKLIKSNKALNGKIIISDWLPGINLITFKMLKGNYPTKEMIIKELKALREVSHNDWVINNMIIQGNQITLIDFEDPRRGQETFCTDKLFEKHIEIINMDNPNAIKELLYAGLK